MKKEWKKGRNKPDQLDIFSQQQLFLLHDPREFD
jgi:hypothetical protein